MVDGIADEHALESSIRNLGGAFVFDLDGASFTPGSEVLDKARIGSEELYVSCRHLVVNRNRHEAI